MAVMQPLKDAMPRALVEIVRRQPISPGKVEFAWSLTVGPAVQRNTAVRLENGVLMVDAKSPQWADEVRRSARVIIARLHSMLGDRAVLKLEVRER